MTHLLGSQDCIDSLRRDLIDLQGVLLEVFCNTGPARFPSWKFPDKLSCNLDLVSLLEEYDYVDGDTEFSQHSHVVLQELLIDRLVLLLQSFNAHAEGLIRKQEAFSPDQEEASGSIGPVVKRYWKNLLLISGQQKQESRAVSCQTVEPGQLPCESCARVQAVMKDSSGAVMSLCQSLGLPCSMQGFLEAVEEMQQLGRLSPSDIIQWASEQQRDLSRVGKHVLEVRETVEPLKKKLKEAEMEREKVKKQFSDSVKREKEEKRKLEEDWERRMLDVRVKGEEALRKLKQEQEEIEKGVTVLQEENSELSAEVKSLTEVQQSLEYTRDSLQQEVQKMHSLEATLREIKEHSRNLEEELSNTQILLEKESARNHSVQRQHEALQVKQTALRKHLDELLRQNEELHSSLDESEEEKTHLADKLTEIRREKDSIQEQLSQQQSQCLSLCAEKQRHLTRISELEERMVHLEERLEETVQRERLLVAYPELNPRAAPQTSGDVVCDMEQQLRANSVRIMVLQKENASLNKSLTRLKDSEERRRSSESRNTEMDTSGESPSMGHIDSTSTPCNTSCSSSPSPMLHHQTLTLSVHQDAEERFRSIRQAARSRSAGTRRRRK